MSFESFGALYPGGGGGDAAPAPAGDDERPEITGGFNPGYFVSRFQSDGVSGTLNNDVHASALPEGPDLTGGPWALVP